MSGPNRRSGRGNIIYCDDDDMMMITARAVPGVRCYRNRWAGTGNTRLVTVRFQFTSSDASDVFISTDLELFVRQTRHQLVLADQADAATTTATQICCVPP
jgi:hypothetical protein